MRLIDADKLVKAVEDLADCYNGFSDTYDKACIIGLIDEQPTIKPPYKLDEWCTDCSEYDKKRNCCPRYNRVIRAAAAAVRANFTPKTGRWIEKIIPIDTEMWRVYYCSECDGEVTYKVPYCPFCGSRNRKEVTE